MRVIGEDDHRAAVNASAPCAIISPRSQQAQDAALKSRNGRSQRLLAEDGLERAMIQGALEEYIAVYILLA